MYNDELVGDDVRSLTSFLQEKLEPTDVGCYGVVASGVSRIIIFC